MAKKNKSIDVFKHIIRAGPDECWKWSGHFGGRQSSLRPYFTTEGKRYIAYRLVYELVKGHPVPDDALILHSCDNGGFPTGCCNPAHMRIGSHKENMADMKHRERHGLPHHVVRAIRKLLADGRTQEQIAELYGVSRETISAIATRRVYNHVKDEEQPQ